MDSRSHSCEHKARGGTCGAKGGKREDAGSWPGGFSACPPTSFPPLASGVELPGI